MLKAAVEALVDKLFANASMDVFYPEASLGLSPGHRGNKGLCSFALVFEETQCRLPTVVVDRNHKVRTPSKGRTGLRGVTRAEIVTLIYRQRS